MIYDTSVENEAEKAWDYLSKLIKAGKLVEVKEVRKKRSLQQNSYLHLAIGLFGLELGYTMEEAKIIYKRYANTDLYLYEKQGIWFLKSSADLDTREMTISIDKFREFALEKGVVIPPPTNEAELRSLQNKLEENQYYLRG